MKTFLGLLVSGFLISNAAFALQSDCTDPSLAAKGISIVCGSNYERYTFTPSSLVAAGSGRGDGALVYVSQDYNAQVVNLLSPMNLDLGGVAGTVSVHIQFEKLRINQSSWAPGNYRYVFANVGWSGATASEIRFREYVNVGMQKHDAPGWSAPDDQMGVSWEFPVGSNVHDLNVQVAVTSPNAHWFHYDAHGRRRHWLGYQNVEVTIKSISVTHWH